jgi:hypothetical protein
VLIKVPLAQGGNIRDRGSQIHQSPVWVLFGATVKRHLESLKERYPNEVAEIEKSLYIDDVITGGGETLKTKSLI